LVNHEINLVSSIGRRCGYLTGVDYDLLAECVLHVAQQQKTDDKEYGSFHTLTLF
jgi:hypothetical protein